MTAALAGDRRLRRRVVTGDRQAGAVGGAGRAGQVQQVLEEDVTRLRGLRAGCRPGERAEFRGEIRQRLRTGLARCRPGLVAGVFVPVMSAQCC
jgi:hypothetical protein